MTGKERPVDRRSAARRARVLSRRAECVIGANGRRFHPHAPSHGYSTYTGWGCQCDTCSADMTRYQADYQHRRRANDGEPLGQRAKRQPEPLPPTELPTAA
ncbi:hypothetical protein [Nocardia terpenica]|uniref:Uncharacterized protein n=1 Tax=Nocardia terpenica TaxID=455432 RepID=A0A164H0V5_9NOCA|nr:hypothetical protein [Nocardia terpenica]KZM68107.1 hypothetical protein AWN90_09200 [Nocardia terpenica]NQE89035.1 hypothetical protein [Nocardia terpenica]